MGVLLDGGNKKITGKDGLLSNGYLSKSVAGGVDVTLSATELQNHIIEVTGIITANINIILGAPYAGQHVLFINSTTGAFTVTVKGSSGTGIVVATGKAAYLFTDGTNWRRATADNP